MRVAGARPDPVRDARRLAHHAGARVSAVAPVSTRAALHHRCPPAWSPRGPPTTSDIAAATGSVRVGASWSPVTTSGEGRSRRSTDVLSGGGRPAAVAAGARSAAGWSACRGRLGRRRRGRRRRGRRRGHRGLGRDGDLGGDRGLASGSPWESPSASRWAVRRTRSACSTAAAARTRRRRGRGRGVVVALVRRVTVDVDGLGEVLDVLALHHPSHDRGPGLGGVVAAEVAGLAVGAGRQPGRRRRVAGRRGPAPLPRTYITAVETCGVMPTNHDEETSSSSLVAVPVLPAAGRSRASASVPDPDWTTCCRA